MVYDILSPTPPLNRFTITEGRAPSSRPRRAAQPADLREGVAKAYDTVREVKSYIYKYILKWYSLFMHVFQLIDTTERLFIVMV